MQKEGLALLESLMGQPARKPKKAARNPASKRVCRVMQKGGLALLESLMGQPARKPQ